MFWCELQTFGDIDHRDVCLLLDIIQLDGALLVVLKAPDIFLKNATVISISGNHEPVTQDNPKASL